MPIAVGLCMYMDRERSCKASRAKTPSNFRILSLIASTMARSLTRIVRTTQQINQSSLVWTYVIEGATASLWLFISLYPPEPLTRCSADGNQSGKCRLRASVAFYAVHRMPVEPCLAARFPSSTN